MEALLSAKQKWNFCYFFFCSCFFIYLINLFFERGERTEEEWERNINVWLPFTCPHQGLGPATQACALTGNQMSKPFGSQVSTRSTEPHQPTLPFLSCIILYSNKVLIIKTSDHFWKYLESKY